MPPRDAGGIGDFLLIPEINRGGGAGGHTARPHVPRETRAATGATIMTTADTTTRLNLLEQAIAEVSQSNEDEAAERIAAVKAIYSRLANIEATVQRHAELLLAKTLPKIYDEIHGLAGIDSDLNNRLRRLEQHFRPWPRTNESAGCSCGG